MDDKGKLEMRAREAEITLSLASHPTMAPILERLAGFVETTNRRLAYDAELTEAERLAAMSNRTFVADFVALFSTAGLTLERANKKLDEML